MACPYKILAGTKRRIDFELNESSVSSPLFLFYKEFLKFERTVLNHEKSNEKIRSYNSYYSVTCSDGISAKERCTMGSACSYRSFCCS